MSVAVLMLLAATVITTVVLLVVMLVKDKPFFGAIGLCILIGPGTLLTFLHLAVAGIPSP
jgi:hypothetical protein